ncbi:MAG TPA: hypothetical protein PK514_07070 [Spirochaetota bacterium]|nr:hypothetical protein [Spirochaetota bacterium]
MTNSNLKKKVLAFGLGVAIMLSGCFDDSGGGNDNNTNPENPPVNDRIVLVNTFNTAATNDIEPINIFDTRVFYGNPDNGGYDETFNTVFYNASQFEAGKKYIFEGQLDSNGKVKDRVNIQGNVTNVDIVVNNAIIYAGNFYGNSKLTFDVPHGPLNPVTPLDKVPVLETDSVSAETIITAPNGAKKRIGGGAPVKI